MLVFPHHRYHLLSQGLLELFDTKEKEKPIRGKVGGKVSEDRFKETQRIAGTRYKFEINVDYKFVHVLSTIFFVCSFRLTLPPPL